MPKSRDELAFEMLETQKNELMRLEIMFEYAEQQSRKVQLTPTGAFKADNKQQVVGAAVKTLKVQIDEKKEFIKFLEGVCKPI